VPSAAAGAFTIMGGEQPMRLSKPLYESLPVVYAVIGGAAVAIAYFEPLRIRSMVAFGIGFFAAIAAVTVFLHRQDRRAMGREYSGQTIDFPSSLNG
jgi:peptidoglycan/LPS O-acetylase OafA/YrhL